MTRDILLSVLSVSVLILGLMVLKSALRKILSAVWRYRLGYLNFLILLLPALPCGKTVNISTSGQVFPITERAGAISSALNGEGVGTLTDFTLNRTTLFNGKTLLIFWIVGAVAIGLVMLISALRLSRAVKTAGKPDKEMLDIFEKCKKEIGISDKIRLLTGKIGSPMVFGILKTFVMIPSGRASQADLRNIFLHELTHYVRGDLAVNYAICFFKIIYWFNPLVWLAFSSLRADMEEACDETVMELTGDSIGYGRTIIEFAGRKGSVFSADMGGSKRRMVKRVRAAANFRKASMKQKVSGAVIFLMTFAFIGAALPAVSVNAVEIRKQSDEENIIIEDLSEYFDGAEGSFVLYDSASDTQTVYNEKQSAERVSPDSTYKIFSALSALESGAISPDQNYMEWDGTEYVFEEWNRDQTLDTAMRNSVNWYFDRLNAENMDSLNKIFDTFNYGNQNISGDDFWLEGSLKISPEEQVEALKAFYYNEYGFDEENVNAVKESMKLADGFYGKTGSGMVNGQEVNGWFVGFAEKNGDVWIFAVNIKNSNGSKASSVAIEILRDRGIIDYEM